MATFSSGKEYARHMAAKYEELLRTNIPFKEAVYNDIARKSIRIFEEGKKSDGSLIGQYSTDPMYANPDYQPRKGAIKTSGGGKLQGLTPTIGKTGKSVFASTGLPHKTTYLPGGYKELRQRQGRKVDHVNIRYTNDLFLDWANVGAVNAAPKPTKVDSSEYVIKLKRSYNVDKKEGLEDKYGTIFFSTIGERKQFTTDLNSRIKVFMSK